MVKLKDAKCPNCGANIQVNDKLENTICQYCGSQVIIEEAIEKYKLEISGKVEVDGIRGRNSKLEQAKKHMKLEEYDAARKIINEIVTENSLDVEAYIELIKTDIELFKKRDFDENSSDITDYDGWNLFNEIVNNYNRAKKIDDNNIVDQELLEYKENIDQYLELNERVEAENKELEEMTKKLNDFYKQIKSISIDCEKAWINELIIKRFTIPGIEASYNGVKGYRLVDFKRLTRDGILECNYKSIYGVNGTWALHSTNPKLYDSMDDIREIFAEIETVSPNYINTSKQTVNDSINKENKKIDRQNTVINAKNKFAQVRIYIDYAIIAIMVIITLVSLIKDGIGTAIAIAIFLDSWIIYLCVYKIKDHKLDMNLNDINKKNNMKRKRDNV